MFDKLVSFTKDVSDLPDDPVMSAATLKAIFDAAPDEVRVYLNKLIDALKSTVNGDSGAKNIGATSISGLTGSDVQTLLEKLKEFIDSKITGDVKIGPDVNGGIGIVSSDRIVLTVGNGQYFTFDDLFGANGIVSGSVRLLMHTNDATFRMEHFNGSGATLVVQTVSNTSDREKKKNIVNYGESALQKINTTPIRHYNFKEEIDGVDLPHVGVIMQEAPLEVVDLRGNGIDVYAMVSMAWKAIQELSERNQELESRIVELEKNNQ